MTFFLVAASLLLLPLDVFAETLTGNNDKVRDGDTRDMAAARAAPWLEGDKKMNIRDVAETDIRADFDTPTLEKAGWHLHTQIREEVPLTAGKALARGSKYKRVPETNDKTRTAPIHE